MGEYARYGATEIKIGTCESMYYLRFEDRGRVTALDGNVDPSSDYNLRYRLPFPDEDDISPGSYQEYNRGARLGDGFKMDEDNAPGIIQLTHPCGLLVNVPCHHGHKLPDMGTCRTFWNGKTWFYELCAVKHIHAGVVPIVRCRHCNSMWRVTWGAVMPHIVDRELAVRLVCHTLDEVSA